MDKNLVYGNVIIVQTAICVCRLKQYIHVLLLAQYKHSHIGQHYDIIYS